MQYIVIFLFVFCSFAYAENPIVSSIDSSIHGSNFGIKTPAAPILFDNFEAGTNGDTLPSHSSWVAYAGKDGGYYTNTQKYSGSLSVFNYVNSDGTGYNEFNTSYFDCGLQSEIFLSYKFKIIGTGSKYGIGKLCRINSSSNAGGGGRYNGAGDSTYQNLNLYYGTSGYWSFNNGAQTIGGDETYCGNITENKWHTVNMYKKLSTPGVADGQFYFEQVGVGKFGNSNALTRANGYNFKIDTVLLGIMYSNVGTRPPCSISMYIDDVYIDNTQQRVEIGDNQNFNNCLHREIQIPASWSDTQITIQFNQGSFKDGDQAYLFVVDSDGNASAGYPVYFVNNTLYSGSPTTVKSNIGSALIRSGSI